MESKIGFLILASICILQVDAKPHETSLKREKRAPRSCEVAEQLLKLYHLLKPHSDKVSQSIVLNEVPDLPIGEDIIKIMVCNIADSSSLKELEKKLAMLGLPLGQLESGYATIIPYIKRERLELMVDIYLDIVRTMDELGFPKFPLHATEDEIKAAAEQLVTRWGQDFITDLLFPLTAMAHYNFSISQDELASAFLAESEAEFLSRVGAAIGKYPVYVGIVYNDLKLGQEIGSGAREEITGTFLDLLEAVDKAGLLDFDYNPDLALDFSGGIYYK